MKNAPLFDKIYNYCQENKIHFHVPGHKSGAGLPPEFKEIAHRCFELDLTELPGLDDLHHPRGVIARAQDLAAQLYGAAQSFFLVNGSTCGLQALLMTAAREGEGVLLPRNAHRSLWAGLVYSGALPVYVQPEIIPYFDIAAGLSVRQVKEKITAAGMAAVLCVHPTYWGVAGNLSGVIRAARQLDRPLPVLVDEAHGTHLYFSDRLPAGALQCGADAAVQSVHKTGGSLTQSSWLHVNEGGRLDCGRLKESLSLVQTSSPSYLLLASLDLARRQWALKGKQMMDAILSLALEARRSISQIKGLTLLGPEHLTAQPAAAPAATSAATIDVTRLVISVRELGLTGYQALDILSRHYGVELEMADHNNIVAVISTGQTRADLRRLVESLREFSLREGRSGVSRPEDLSLLPPPVPPLRLTPRQAWISRRSRPVKISQAAGLVSGEMVCVYPPGIPVIYPGEEITLEIRDYLLAVRRAKLHCQGPEDAQLNTIRVLEI